MNADFLNIFPGIFCRALGLFAFLPFGSELTGVALRFVLAAGLAVIFGTNLQTSDFVVHGLLIEFLIGILISLPLILILNLAESFGELIDNGRGQTIAQNYDPISNNSISHLAIFSKNFVLAYLFIAGNLDLNIAAFKESLSLVPIYKYANLNFQILGSKLLVYLTASLDGLLSTSLIFLATFLLIEFAIGIIGKLVPNVSLTTENYLCKSFAAFMLILMLLGFKLETGLFELARPNFKLIM